MTDRDWLIAKLCAEFPVYRDAASYEVAPRMRRVADEILARFAGQLAFGGEQR